MQPDRRELLWAAFGCVVLVIMVGLVFAVNPVPDERGVLVVTPGLPPQISSAEANDSAVTPFGVTAEPAAPTP